MEGLIVAALTFILSFVLFIELSKYVLWRGRVFKTIDSKTYLLYEGVGLNPTVFILFLAQRKKFNHQ